MWLRRKEGFIDEGEEYYWVQIKDKQPTMEVETDSAVDEDKTAAGKDNVMFSQISPIDAFKKVKSGLNPLKNTISRTRDGLFNIQIPRNEVSVAVQVTELEGVPVTVEKHPFLNNTRGTVFEVNTIDMSVEDITSELHPYNVVKVVKKTYYNKKAGKKQISGELVLTFDKIKRPEYIDLAWLTHLKVEAYEPKPMICNTCFTFGSKCFSFGEELKNECKNQQIPLCGWCLGNEHIKNGEKCNQPVKCKNCDQNDHPSWSRKCPAYIREKEILCIKEEKKITYNRAKSILDGRLKSGKSTAAVVVAKDLEDKERDWQKKWEENNRKWEEEMESTNHMWQQRLANADREWSKRIDQVEHDWKIRFQKMQDALESKIDFMMQMMQKMTATPSHQMQVIPPMYPTQMMNQQMSTQSMEYREHMQKSLSNWNFLSDAAAEDEQPPHELRDDSMDWFQKEDNRIARRRSKPGEPPIKVKKHASEKQSGDRGDPGGH